MSRTLGVFMAPVQMFLVCTFVFISYSLTMHTTSFQNFGLEENPYSDAGCFVNR